MMKKKISAVVAMLEDILTESDHQVQTGPGKITERYELVSDALEQALAALADAIEALDAK